MLYFDRIYVSEGIDVNWTSASKECDICYYCYFLNKEFKFQSDVYNGCHDALMMSLNLNDTAILNIYGVNYRCTIKKSEAIKLLQKADLSERNETL